MSYETQRAAIEGRFQTYWTSTNIKWNNVPFIIPADGSSWVYLHVVNGYGYNDAFGGLRQRHEGLIVVEIYAKEGTGTKSAYTLGDAALAIFSNQVFNGVHCYASYINDLGADSEWKGWYRIDCITPFYRLAF